VTNDVKNKIVIFEIDPARLDVNGGYDCIYFTMGLLAGDQLRERGPLCPERVRAGNPAVEHPRLSHTRGASAPCTPSSYSPIGGRQ
jgi:hypothetical protein